MMLYDYQNSKKVETKDIRFLEKVLKEQELKNFKEQKQYVKDNYPPDVYSCFIYKAFKQSILSYYPEIAYHHE